VKTSVHVEFTDDELSDFGSRVLLKVVGSAWQSMEGAFSNPQAASIVMNAMQQVLQAGQVGAQQRRPRGPVAAVAFQPGMYGAPPGANGPVGPGNVRPIRPEGAIDRCFRVEETRGSEAGIVCCNCATYNAAARSQCRHCGHPLCHEKEPPVPAPPPIRVPGPEPPEGA